MEYDTSLHEQIDDIEYMWRSYNMCIRGHNINITTGLYNSRYIINISTNKEEITAQKVCVCVSGRP